MRKKKIFFIYVHTKHTLFSRVYMHEIIYQVRNKIKKKTAYNIFDKLEFLNIKRINQSVLSFKKLVQPLHVSEEIKIFVTLF